MKKNRSIIWLLVVTVLLCSLPLTTGAANERTTENIPVLASSNDYADDVIVTMGQKEGTLIFTWTTNGDENERVEIVEASKMTNGSFPKDFLSFTAEDVNSQISTATAFGLKADTEYCYRLANAYNNYSDLHYITTGKADNEFSFLLAGDPQIGASTDHADTMAWCLTLEKANEWFGSDIEFLLTAGDQTNNTSLDVQFQGFAEPEQLRELPLMTVVGNHDNGTNALYSNRFIYQNVDDRTLSSAGEYGGDYWVAYDGTLIMTLNLNNLSYAVHRDFMENAIAEYTTQYGEPNWKIVTFHQSLFSAAAGRWEEASRRKGLAPILSELDVDAVLMGHDHIYTRAYMMNALNPITDESRYTEVNGDKYGSIVDPKDGEVFYITANSSTGSKYYDLHKGTIPYVAYANQESLPNITKIDVTADSMVFTTYRTSAGNELGDVVDFFAIRKTTTQDNHAPTITAPEKTYYAANKNYDILSGIFAYDNVDGDLTADIKASGTLDPFGESVITYTVTDKAGNTATAQRLMIPYNMQDPLTADSEWKYLDDGSVPFENDEDIAWTLDSYDDSSWKTGVGPFGSRNGEISEHDGFIPNTLVSQYFTEGMDVGINMSTMFFKGYFDLEDPENINIIGADFFYDDGVDIYINGVLINHYNTEALSSKMDYNPYEAPSDATPGSFKLMGKDFIKSLNLKEKDNVIAVQLYQFSIYSDDIFFYLESLYAGSVPSGMPFEDVSKDAWYYESVANSYNKGLFVGTTETTFSPDATMTRASVWTVLARIEGADISVKEGEDWYEGARRWAMENGVSDGTNPN
ncbi:MAG: metallophosphoesterase, partial [Clostridia bacterium]|nr:metallophosphoesterase [Clostridia bacterium]